MLFFIDYGPVQVLDRPNGVFVLESQFSIEVSKDICALPCQWN